MNKKRLSLVIVMTFLLVLPFVNAAELTRGALRNVGDTLSEVFKFLTVNVRIPHGGVYGGTEDVSLFALFFVFIILYILFYLATGYVKIFKEAGSKGPRTWFCIAVTLLIIFGTPITETIYGWIGGTFGTVFAIIFIVMMFVGLIKFTKRTGADFGEIGAETAKMKADNIKNTANAEKVIDSMDDIRINVRNTRRARRNIRKLRNKLIKNQEDIGKRLETIREMLPNINTLINQGQTDEAKKMANKALNELTNLIQDVVNNQKIKENIININKFLEKDSEVGLAAEEKINKELEDLRKRIEISHNKLLRSKYQEKTKKQKIEKLQEASQKIAEAEEEVKRDLRNALTSLNQSIEEMKSAKLIGDNFISVAKELQRNLTNGEISSAGKNIGTLINLWNENLPHANYFNEQEAEISRLSDNVDRIRKEFINTSKEIKKMIPKIYG